MASLPKEKAKKDIVRLMDYVDPMLIDVLAASLMNALGSRSPRIQFEYDWLIDDLNNEKKIIKLGPKTAITLRVVTQYDKLVSIYLDDESVRIPKSNVHHNCKTLTGISGLVEVSFEQAYVALRSAPRTATSISAISAYHRFVRLKEKGLDEHLSCYKLALS